MKTRREIVENWLPRYTGVPLKQMGEYILLTNFHQYVKLFAQWHRVKVVGKDRPMSSATAGKITIKHGPLKQFDMDDGMTMVFRAQDPAMLKAVKAGRISLDTLITVSPNAAAQAPTKMGFKVGSKITVDNALKTIMVKSANDMSVALAEGVVASSVHAPSSEAAKIASRIDLFMALRRLRLS